MRSVHPSTGAFLIGLAAIGCLFREVQAQTVNYRGRVLDRVGMDPVAGATVKAGNITVTTDAEGRFTLQGNPTRLAPAGPEKPVFALQGRTLLVENRQAGQTLRVELLDASGRSVSVAMHPLSATGSRRVELLLRGRDFVGFLRLGLGGEVRVGRILSLAGVVRSSFLGGGNKKGDAETGLAKGAAAAVEVTVAMAKLLPKTLSPASNDADLGDIVLDYPPRKPGLHSPPPFGALVLFPAKGDSASARGLFESLWIHKMNGWRQGQGLGTTPVLWKVAPDPESTPAAYKPSLLPCCQPRNGSPEWGYDDIVTKKLFRDYQLHLEFNLMGASDGNVDTSGWCNSGVYLTGSQELQIQTPDPRSATQQYWRLHDLATLINEKVPDRNMHLGPGKWQSYDVTWRAPRNSPGKVTVYWNGERVHNNVNWGSGAGNPVGFSLQNEKGTDVRFRNVWIKELEIAEPQTDFGY